jgi:Pretoxin HINT domain
VRCDGLEIGDRIATETGSWVPVEDLLDTGEWEPLYNFRVADFHTYFVGVHDWGFSVWTHNACIGYRVVDQKELPGALLGIWTDSILIAGQPEELGSKWTWVKESSARLWYSFLVSHGERGLSVTLVPTKNDISTYPQFPHPPQGMAAHVPITDMGPAVVI